MSYRHFKSTLVGRFEITLRESLIPTRAVFANYDSKTIYNKNFRILNHQQRYYSNELNSSASSDIRSRRNKKSSTGGEKHERVSENREFNLEDVGDPTSASEVLKAQTEYENSLKYTSRSNKNQIRREKRENSGLNDEDTRSATGKSLSNHNYIDNWRVRTGNNGKLHDNSDRTLSERIKYNDYIENMKKSKENSSKENLFNNSRKPYNKPKRNSPVNNRYTYLSEINKVKDNFSNSPIPWSTESLQSISEPISSPSSLIPRHKNAADTYSYKLTDLNYKLWELIKDFPIVLLFKPNETYNNHYSWEKLTNLLEIENKIYNEQQRDDNDNKIDLNFVDPNNLELLVDYFIINDLRIVENTFTNFINKKSQINSSTTAAAAIDLSSVFNSIRELNSTGHIVCITELGFKSANNILEVIKENTKMYKPVCCMLNTIDHPFLTKIRKSIHHASNEELLNEKFKQELKRDELDDTNKILESNMYSIASLGLIKVQKESDGTIFLTER